MTITTKSHRSISVTGTLQWHSSSPKNNRCCATARAALSATRRRCRICAAARQQGRHRLFPRALEGVRRDGIFRPAGAGEIRRQRARLRRGRRRDGGNRPHPDAVAVSVAPRVLAASALSRGGSEAQKSAHLPKIRGRLAARRARDRRGRKASPAADQNAGGALRQRLQAQRRQGLRGRRPHRRSPDRRGAHRRRRRRAQRADAVPGRSQGQGHRDRAHRDGRCAQRGAHRVRQCRGQRRQRARRGRSGRRAAGRRAQYRPRRGGLRNGGPERRSVRPHRRRISRSASSSAS